MGYEDLANAIIVQTTKDYKTALIITMGRNPSKADLGRVIELEKFFRGSWYKCLTDVDGEYLIEQIRKEVKEQCDLRKGTNTETPK